MAKFPQIAQLIAQSAGTLSAAAATCSHRTSLSSYHLHLRVTIYCLILAGSVRAQSLGGNSVFNFLKLPNTPQLSALGGVNVSSVSNDVGLAFNNPALLDQAMHTQVNAAFNSFYDGITAYHLSLGYHSPKLNTTFSWGLNYLSYGDVLQTDASGNLLGNFRPTDWVMQVSAARRYLERWHYGMTMKFIHSGYGQYRSNGIAADVGVLYKDTSNGFSASVLAKNMGTQLKKYAGTDAADLPFDLQIGMTKRLQNSPFGFSVTAHHIHQFDLIYNDTTFNNTNGFGNSNSGLDKFFRHFVVAANIYLGDNVELAMGYNYLRRKELSIGSTGNGLTGFSMGLSLLLNKLQVRYARSQYQNNTAYNQFGLNISLNQ
ncbi:MAG: type IX secretion system protein PorQ, partial [Sphingobacteriales bacterium]